MLGGKGGYTRVIAPLHSSNFDGSDTVRDTAPRDGFSALITKAGMLGGKGGYTRVIAPLHSSNFDGSDTVRDTVPRDGFLTSLHTTAASGSSVASEFAKSKFTGTFTGKFTDKFTGKFTGKFTDMGTSSWKGPKSELLKNGFRLRTSPNGEANSGLAAAGVSSGYDGLAAPKGRQKVTGRRDLSGPATASACGTIGVSEGANSPTLGHGRQAKPGCKLPFRNWVPKASTLHVRKRPGERGSIRGSSGVRAARSARGRNGQKRRCARENGEKSDLSELLQPWC